tara:strand:+ start:697 stop:840 length:144 start_codon:yes stop_codon:yes gene_type:complete
MAVEEVLFGDRVIESKQVELKGWRLTNPQILTDDLIQGVSQINLIRS